MGNSCHGSHAVIDARLPFSRSHSPRENAHAEEHSVKYSMPLVQETRPELKKLDIPGFVTVVIEQVDDDNGQPTTTRKEIDSDRVMIPETPRVNSRC